jgi:hypothetical protein
MGLRRRIKIIGMELKRVAVLGTNFRRMARLHNGTFAASKVNGSWDIGETGEQNPRAVLLEVLCNTRSFELRARETRYRAY